jgi:hypothetical protein
MSNFPKRYDLLAENTAYAVDTIEVSKKLSNDDLGIESVTFLVTCQYDLLENIQDREAGSSGGGSDDDDDDSQEEERTEDEFDEDDHKVDNTTPPWKYRAKFSYQYQERQVPLLSGFNASNNPTVAIVTTAGDYIETMTTKYIMEISYQKNYENPQSKFDELMEPYTNTDSIKFTSILPEKTFPSGTLLILPPTYSRELWEKEETSSSGTTTKSIKPYHSYSVKLLYNPDGWTKRLLNCGVRAKFSGTKSEQIYNLTLTDSNGILMDGYPKYVSLSEVVAAQNKSKSNNTVVGYEAITVPVFLDENGKIALNSQTGSTSSNNYKSLEFKVYKSTAFSSFPFKK